MVGHVAQRSKSSSNAHMHQQHSLSLALAWMAERSLQMNELYYITSSVLVTWHSHSATAPCNAPFPSVALGELALTHACCRLAGGQCPVPLPVDKTFSCLHWRVCCTVGAAPQDDWGTILSQIESLITLDFANSSLVGFAGKLMSLSKQSLLHLTPSLQLCVACSAEWRIAQQLGDRLPSFGVFGPQRIKQPLSN